MSNEVLELVVGERVNFSTPDEIDIVVDQAMIMYADEDFIIDSEGISTEQKRRAAFNFGRWPMGTLPEATGSVDGEARAITQKSYLIE